MERTGLDEAKIRVGAFNFPHFDSQILATFRHGSVIDVREVERFCSTVELAA